VTAEFLEFLT